MEPVDAQISHLNRLKQVIVLLYPISYHVAAHERRVEHPFEARSHLHEVNHPFKVQFFDQGGRTPLPAP